MFKVLLLKMISSEVIIMKLEEYRDKYNLTNVKLAKKFGVTPSCLHHWISGRAKISLKNALIVYKKTKKEVTLHDLGFQ